MNTARLSRRYMAGNRGRNMLTEMCWLWNPSDSDQRGELVSGWYASRFQLALDWIDLWSPPMGSDFPLLGWRAICACSFRVWEQFEIVPVCLPSHVKRIWQYNKSVTSTRSGWKGTSQSWEKNLGYGEWKFHPAVSLTVDWSIWRRERWNSRRGVSCRRSNFQRKGNNACERKFKRNVFVGGVWQVTTDSVASEFILLFFLKDYSFVIEG